MKKTSFALVALLLTAGAKADGGMWPASIYAVNDTARPEQLAQMDSAGVVAIPLPVPLDNDLVRRGIRRQPGQPCFALAMPFDGDFLPTDTLVCQGAVEVSPAFASKTGTLAEIAAATHADLGRLEAGHGPVTVIHDAIRGWPECNELACKTDFAPMIPPDAERIANPQPDTDKTLFFFRAKVE